MTSRSDRRWSFSSLLRIVGVWCTVAALMSGFVVAGLFFLPWRHRRIVLSNKFGRAMGRTVLWLMGTPAAVRNLDAIERNAPAIYVLNHSSSLDMFAVLPLFPDGSCGVGKKELTRVPFFGQAYFLAGHLLVDRQNRQSAIRSLGSLASYVRDHKLSIWIAPEGTRSRDGELLPFKRGFVHLALETGLPVVPIVLHNARNRLPMGSLLVDPGPLDILVLDTIDTSGWHIDTTEQHAHEVREIFVKALAAPLPPTQD